MAPTPHCGARSASLLPRISLATILRRSPEQPVRDAGRPNLPPRSMTSKGISRPNTEQLRLSLDSLTWTSSEGSEEITAGPSSHWTLSAATPSAHYSSWFRSPSVYSAASPAHGSSTRPSYCYPDARNDPRRFAFLPPQQHRPNRHSDATSPPVLILKLYRRTRAKKTTKKVTDAAQSSAKAVSRLLHLPTHSASHDIQRHVPRKLRRPPPQRPDMEISRPFPSGNMAGFEPSPPAKGGKEDGTHPPSRAWHLPTLSRSKSQRVIEISSPFPIRDPPAGCTPIVRALSPPAWRKARPKPGGPRTPSNVNFSTEIRRVKSERRTARAGLPGWKYLEYSPVPPDGQSGALVHAMSTIVRGRDHPFRAPTM
ncbi:hypothetical protein FB451DRAFT_165820 [Mycena latifolia]|nr:hypothetical protein FB451DRAFT_165820 [Mycena latifolia]